MGKDYPLSQLANAAGTVVINPATSDNQPPNIFNEGYLRKLYDSTIQAIPYRGAQVEFDTDIHAPMESMIVDSATVKTLAFGSGDTGVCQIFRASEDNLHDVRITMKGSGAIATLDNMEYATDGAAQAAWVPSDSVNTNVFSEATIINQGTYSLKIQCEKNDSPGDTITKTISSTDFTDKVIRFSRYNDIGNSKCVWKFRISDDGTDWYESQFTSVNANVWEEINITVGNMTLVGTGVNLAAITKIQFYMVSCISPQHYFYIDQLELLGESGIAYFKLYDFGADGSPTDLSDGTQLTFDEGHTAIEIELPANKRIVNIHAHYGAHDRANKLTVGNYYGLVIDGLTSGTLDLYGSSTKLYASGTFFTENAGALTSTTKSLRFLSFAITDSVINHYKLTFDASPGSSVIYTPVKDYNNNELMVNFLGTVYCHNRTSIDIDLDCIPDIPQYVNADIPFRPLYSDDDDTSSATEVLIEVCYAYKPIATYN